MTFMPRYVRPATFTRSVSRAGPPPRIADAPEVNQPSAEPVTFPGPTKGLKLFDDIAQIPDGGRARAGQLGLPVRLRPRPGRDGGAQHRHRREVRAIMGYNAGALQLCFAIGGRGRTASST